MFRRRYSEIRSLKSGLGIFLTLAVILFFPAAAQAAPVIDITTGLVAHWTFDETSGTTANDSALSNDGTMEGGMTGATNSGPGRFATGFDFDGVDDSITVAHDSSLSFTNSYTYATWIYFDSTLGSSQPSMIGKNYTGGWGQRWTLGRTSGGGDVINGHVRIGVSHDTTEAFTSWVFPVDRWIHVAVVWDGSNLYFYSNGVLVDTQPMTVVPTLNAGDITIGMATHNWGAYYFDGPMDDVRLYNRALSASDVAALAGDWQPGVIRYNTDYRVPEYFNGTQWIAMGESIYMPNAVGFPFGPYLSRTTNFTGVADSKMITGSFWVQRYGGHGTRQMIYAANQGSTASDTNSRFRIEFATDNRIQFVGRTSVPATALDAKTSTAITDKKWHHVLFSFDLNNPASRYIYLDGVADLNGTPNTHTNSTMHFLMGSPRHGIGARHTGVLPLDGYLSDFWLDIGRYVDISSASNRLKFIDASGNPVNLGSTGANPFGTAPDIFLSGPTSTWHNNSSGNGGFTLNGTLVAPFNYPGDPEGTPCEGMGSARRTDPDTGHCYFRSTATATWADAQTACQAANGYLAGVSSLEEDTLIGTYLVTSAPYWIGGTDETVSGEWRWIGGEQAGKQFWQGVDYPGNGGTPITNMYAGWGTGEPNDFNGLATENCAFTYDFAPSWNDSNCTDTELYVCEIPYSCTNPLGRQGHIFYNEDEDVLQYCDGEAWRAMGTVSGAGGGGCSNPSRSAGTVIYNADHQLMQYCDGADWVQLGKKWTVPTTNLIAHWKLDETSGTTVEDSVGTYDGTIPSSPPNWRPGYLANAMEFTGSGADRVTINATAFDDLSEGTISAWVKWEGSGFDGWFASSGPGGYFELAVNANNFEFWTGGGCGLRMTAPISNPTQWHHLAFTVDSSGNKMYIDGLRVTPTYTVGDSTSAVFLNVCGGSPYHIGGTEGFTETFDGYVDDVRFYDRALTGTEIIHLYYGTGGQ